MPSKKPSDLITQATGAVLRVGDGHGFVIEHTVTLYTEEKTYSSPERLIVTAAHCLPTNEDKALQYLLADPGPTHGAIQLATMFYHLARIV